MLGATVSIVIADVLVSDITFPAKSFTFFIKI